MTSKVIGEGAYGCVHKPSLKCKNDPSKSYDGKISKIMDTVDAITELKEYDVINAVDKDLKYHMGKPDVCSPSDDLETIKSIDKCDWVKSNDIANMKLLIMKDGGLNLDDYMKNIKQRTKKDIDMLLIELHRVILGVNTLNQNGIVHHDLKPQNIVYNSEEIRMNFIDFGHMRMIDSLKNKSIQSINTHAVSHWSFPPELVFQNKEKYMRCANMTIDKRIRLFPKLVEELKKHTTPFYRYIKFTSDDKRHLSYCDLLQKKFYDMFVNDMTPDNYNFFLTKSINTVDVYGMGMTILRIIGPMFSSRLLDKNVFNDLISLGFNAINPRISERYDVDQLLNEYESILTNNEILKRNGLYIESHDILPYNIPDSDLEIVSSAKIPSVVRTTISPAKIPSVVGTTISPAKIPSVVGTTISPAKIPSVVGTSVTPCELSGRERNPITRRCVKKCGDGYKRDANFNCAIIKICPEDKEINPNTRRCVKKCKDGYLRNANFRCTKKSSALTKNR